MISKEISMVLSTWLYPPCDPSGHLTFPSTPLWSESPIAFLWDNEEDGLYRQGAPWPCDVDLNVSRAAEPPERWIPCSISQLLRIIQEPTFWHLVGT